MKLLIVIAITTIPTVITIVIFAQLWWAICEEIAEENLKRAGEDMSKLSRYDRFVLRRILQENERRQHE